MFDTAPRASSPKRSVQLPAHTAAARVPRPNVIELAKCRSAGGPHGFLGLSQPLDAFEQAAQHFPIGRLHVQRQRDHVVHHEMRW